MSFLKNVKPLAFTAGLMMFAGNNLLAVECSNPQAGMIAGMEYTAYSDCTYNDGGPAGKAFAIQVRPSDNMMPIPSTPSVEAKLIDITMLDPLPTSELVDDQQQPLNETMIVSGNCADTIPDVGDVKVDFIANTTYCAYFETAFSGHIVTIEATTGGSDTSPLTNVIAKKSPFNSAPTIATIEEQTIDEDSSPITVDIDVRDVNGDDLLISTSISDNSLAELSVIEAIPLEQLGSDILGENDDDVTGYSVALNSDGTRMIVGSKESNYVKVYNFNGETWEQLGSNIVGESVSDEDGKGLSINSNGTRIAVGAPSYTNDGGTTTIGQVKIYDYIGVEWVQVGADIVGKDDGESLGRSVSLSSDGTRIAISAPKANSGKGYVSVYDYNGSSWEQVGTDIDGEIENEYSGNGVSLSSNGNSVAIGSPNEGNVKIYTYNSTSWEQLGTSIAGDSPSGKSLDINADGTRVVIGNTGYDNSKGRVKVYDYNGTGWEQVGSNIDGEETNIGTGKSVSISDDGSRIAIGAPGYESSSGQVRVLEYKDSDWVELDASIVGSSRDSLGRSAILSGDGNYVAGGAPNANTSAGATRVYKLPIKAKLTITPKSNASGVATVTVSADDGTTQTHHSFEIVVNNVNDAPVVVINNDLNIQEDTQGSLTFALSDVEDESLTLSVQTQALNGTVEVTGTNVSYTPNVNFNGSDSFVVSTTDADEATVTKTINVTVSSVNDVPTITIDSTLSTDEDNGESLTFALSDVEDESLTLSVQTQALNGTVEVTGTNVSYTPNANFNGSDSFVVSTTDADEATVTKTINVTVASVNDVPVVVIDSTLSTQEDGSSSLSFSVTDVDGNTVEATLSIEPEYGVATIEGTTLTYTPTLNYNGSDSFTLLFDDGFGGVVTETISVNVSSVNDEPVISINTTMLLNEDGSSSIEFTYQDIDGDIVSASLELLPHNGTVEIQESSITYVPRTGFSGNDSFMIALSDANGYVTMKTVDVTILAKTIEVDVNPTNTNEVNSQESSANEDGSFTKVMLFEDADAKETRVELTLPLTSKEITTQDSSLAHVLESNNVKVVSLLKSDATVEVVQLKSDENNNTKESKVTSNRENIKTIVNADASVEMTSKMQVNKNLMSTAKVTLNTNGMTLHEMTFTDEDGVDSSLRVDSNVVGVTTELKADGSTLIRTPTVVMEDGSESEVTLEITPEGITVQTLIVTKADGTQVITPMMKIRVNPIVVLDIKVVEEADGSVSLKTRTLIPESGFTREK